MPDYATLTQLYHARVAAYPDAPSGYPEQWRQLTVAVLAHGGRLVVPPLEPDPQISGLLTDGRLYEGQVRMTRGRASQCHANISHAWALGRAHTIVTGYALSSDGLWRQHTWGLRGVRIQNIVESTEHRTAYFGVPLGAVDALLFAIANNPSAVEHATSLPPTPRTRELWSAMFAAQQALATAADDGASSTVGA